MEKICISTPLNFFSLKKEQLSRYGKAAQEFVLIKEYSKAQLCGKKRVFAVKWSPLQRENRNLLLIFYLALQTVSSSCVFYFRNSIADTEVGTKLGTTDKQKALKSCDFKAFCWWGKVDLPLRGINFESTTPPNKNSRHPDGYLEFLVGEGGFEPPKSLTTDLQSAPFGHSGIPPYSLCCAAERLELVDGLEPPTC